MLTPGPNRDETRAVFEWLRPDVELITDLGPAEWFSATLEPWGRHGVRLASFMPDGFESYARVLHPFELWDGRTTTYRRWSDVAAERGASIDAETFAEQVAGEDWEAIGGNHPSEGEIPEAVCASLVRTLAGATKTPAACWFAVWSGWGMLSGARIVPSISASSVKEQRAHQQAQRATEAALQATPQITAVHGSSGRHYLLFRGPIDAACSFEPDGWYLSPSFWWPDDRARAVVTEIDGKSTYVGGARATVDAILEADNLEALEVTRNVRLD